MWLLDFGLPGLVDESMVWQAHHTNSLAKKSLYKNRETSFSCQSLAFIRIVDSAALSRQTGMEILRTSASTRNARHLTAAARLRKPLCTKLFVFYFGSV